LLNKDSTVQVPQSGIPTKSERCAMEVQFLFFSPAHKKIKTE